MCSLTLYTRINTYIQLEESKLGICPYFLYNNSIDLKLMYFYLFQVFKILIIPHNGRHLRF